MLQVTLSRANRLLGICLTLLIAALLLAACGGSSGNAPATSASAQEETGAAGEETEAVGSVASVGGSGGAEVAEANWVATGAPTSLNMYRNWNFSTFDALGNVLEGLQRYSPEGKTEPALAISAKRLNPTTYEYQLDPKTKFSDGSPVLASDVAYSMNYARNPNNGFFTGTYYQAASVSDVEATGPHTVVVHLSKPNNLWATFTAYPAMWVMPEHLIKEHESSEDLGTPGALPIGSGPYKIVSYVPNQSVTLEPNPYWEGAEPKIKKLTLSFVEDDATRLQAIKSGQADGTFSVPPNNVRNYEQLENVNLARYRSAYYGNVEFVMTKPPFDDVHIRRMFAYATDREALIKSVLGGNARVAQALTPPEMWVNNGVTEQEVQKRYDEFPYQYEFDMEKAKSELEKSKYAGTTVSFEFLVPSDETPYVASALQNTAQNLATIGVHMKIKAVPGAQLYAGVYTHRATNSLQGEANIGFSDIPNGMENPYLNFYSGFAIPTAYNVSYYKNKEMDELLAKALEDPNPKQASAAGLDAVELSMKDLPQFTLWWEDTVTAISKSLAATEIGSWSLLGPWALSLSGAKE